jgi:ABC-2 type transport system ATP-binding protein
MTDTVPAADPARDPALVDDPVIEVQDLSVWFGQKVALSELTCSFGPGLSGLLGPNGAGKTTLMRAMVGLVKARTGTVRHRGLDPRTDRTAHRNMALVPEDDAVPSTLTARQLVRYTAALHRVPGDEPVEAALRTVELVDDADRALGQFSKGMRQRAKVAAALVTDPSVLVLDEPLNGADPVQRRHLIALFKELAEHGRTVIVSSHVLHEVEMMASRVIVIVNGRLAAAGDRHAIRDAMADTPRRFRIRADRPRDLAAGLVGLDAVVGVTLRGEVVEVSTSRAGDLTLALPVLARERQLVVTEMVPLDDSLEALFRELVS